MKTHLPNQLTTVAEIENFISELIKNDEMFHLDDDANDIVNGHTNEMLFTKEEGDKINTLLKQAFYICDVWNLKVVTDYVDSFIA